MTLNLNKILVPVDFSELSLDAISYAGKLAKKTGAKVILLHIVESYENNVIFDDVVEFNKILESKIDEKILKIKQENQDLLGVTIESRVAKGKIHLNVQKIASEENVDLIVMGTHGAEGVSIFGSRLLGSNAFRTVQLSDIPVITLREGKDEDEINDIILPLDSTKETFQKVEIAAKFAMCFDADIHLVTVVEFFEEFVTDLEEVQVLHERVGEVLLKRGVKQVLSKVIRNKGVSDAIMEYSKSVSGDLILIMVRQEGKINEYVVGSKARTLITRSTTPVLSVTPKKV